MSRIINRPLALCGAAPPAYANDTASQQDPLDITSAAAADEEAGGAAAAAAAGGGRGGQRLFGARGGGGVGGRRRVRTMRRALKVISLQLMFLGQLPIVFG